MLLDRRFHVDDRGRWKLKEGWLTTATNVRFTFRVIADIYGLPEITFDGDGWRAFKDSICIRNRVTHPKVLEEFDISEKEVEDLNAALNWFNERITYIIPELIKGFMWDEERVRMLMDKVPEKQRKEFLAKLVEHFR